MAIPAIAPGLRSELAGVEDCGDIVGEAGDVEIEGRKVVEVGGLAERELVGGSRICVPVLVTNSKKEGTLVQKRFVYVVVPSMNSSLAQKGEAVGL